MTSISIDREGGRWRENRHAPAPVPQSSLTSRNRNGPSEFHVIGSLRGFDISPLLPRIQVPTLLINGAHDEATDDTVRPFFELIPGKVKWRTLGNSAHMAHVEERGAYVECVRGFLGGKS